MNKILMVIIIIALFIPCSLSRAEEDPVGIIIGQFFEELDEGGLVKLKKEIIRQSKALRAIKHLREFVVTNLPDVVGKWYDDEIHFLEAELSQNIKLFFEAYEITKELEIKLQEIFKEKEKTKFETINV